MSYPVSIVHRMRPKSLLRRMRQGHLHNVSFRDFERLLQSCGWELDRQKGSHRVYHHASISEQLVVQPSRDGEATPYQLRELLGYVEDYDLCGEEE